ncbi:VOC family protein [Methylibium sp.]|uniref:VOC family protein n=1 Tax=Methylibium sp. TaxID=2067992 RepID=UPI0033429F57|eukprot:Opistho-2@41281
MKILNILTRQHLGLALFDATVAFYEDLLGQEARLRLTLLDGRLRIAQVASMLLIGAEPVLLDTIADVRAAYLVEDVEAFAEHLPRQGAMIVEPLVEIATGWSMVVRHPDGLLVEYVEHARKNPADRMPVA